ncbi:MAG: hypothetical protein ACE5D6_08770 [Candidatus Zixiibacteriota bacterium]
MPKLKWYHYLVLIIPGGLILMVIIYLVLRINGMLYKFTSRNEKWVDYEN